MLSLTPILMHSEAVPDEVRSALRAAFDAPPERKQGRARKRRCARSLPGHRSRVPDVRELFGLPDGSCS